MAIAARLQDYMSNRGLRYDVLTHPHSHNSMQTAELAHIPGDSLAKSVILEDDKGYLMAVLPSTEHVRLGQLGRELNARLRLATEADVARLFDDCEPGAIPPIGMVYGLRVMVDDRLSEQEEIYFEAGDHERLIQVSREDFLAMTADAGRGRFGERHWHH